MAGHERYAIRIQRGGGRLRSQHVVRVVLRAGVGLREAAELVEEWARTMARAGGNGHVVLEDATGRCLEAWRVAGGTARATFSVAWGYGKEAG